MGRVVLRGDFGVCERLKRNVNGVYSFCGSLSLLIVRGGDSTACPQAKSYSRMSTADSTKVVKKKRLVVLGTGWGAMDFLNNLKNTSFDVQIISPLNYYALNPLLPCVACGTLQARSVAEPVRNFIRKKNVDMLFWEAECTKIDAKKHRVYCRSNLESNMKEKEEITIHYDYLLISVGSQWNTFNIPGVAENCHFLKNLEDAEKIRRTIIDCFERVSLPNISEKERKGILHFVVVGGGPTGVELAGQLHDYVNKDLAMLYPNVKDLAKVTLVEAADHILNMFDKKVRDFAIGKFERDGLEVKTGAMVVKVSEKEIHTKEAKSGEVTSMSYGMVVWSTGIGTRPLIKDFAKQIGQAATHALATDEWLRVEGCDSIYAIGDCAAVNQRRVLDDISTIFDRADTDKSGTLTVTKLQGILKDLKERYPQVETYFKTKKIGDLVHLLRVVKGDAPKRSGELDIEEFKSALSEVDSHIKKLPATGQVASQQGEYLAHCCNHMEECLKNPEGPLNFRKGRRHHFQPFRYNHLGILVSLGGEKAGAQIGLEILKDRVMTGRIAQTVWYLTYLSKLKSWRTRVHVMAEWIRRFIFGRDPNCVRGSNMSQLPKSDKAARKVTE